MRKRNTGNIGNPTQKWSKPGCHLIKIFPSLQILIEIYFCLLALDVSIVYEESAVNEVSPLNEIATINECSAVHEVMLDEENLGSDDEMTVMLMAMSRLGFSKKDIKTAICKKEEKWRKHRAEKKLHLRKGKKFGSFGMNRATPPQLHHAQPK